MPLAWQTIDQQQQPTGPTPGLIWFLRTDRANISGGWLVRTVLLNREMTTPSGGTTDIETSWASGITFVPDPSHSWI